MMRCLSYCTASSYQMELLAEHLNKKNYKLQYFDDVIYIKCKGDDDDVKFSYQIPNDAVLYDVK